MTEKIAKRERPAMMFSVLRRSSYRGELAFGHGSRSGGGAAACEVMTTPPDAKTHKMMGKYDLEAAATAAMATMKECGG